MTSFLLSQSLQSFYVEVDSMVRQCFQTMCKEWMVECHWYCDSVRDQETVLFQKTLHRCQECLSYRGQQCMDCFDL
ncbi:unnamed protein product [Cylicostephanus goldi]|uniref:Uncharacterized protein n=1 Tax=Cylicostephanus goldi TaxID=71465 RepID=A0A3P6R375_CYLGO|nr:unnamed protein product [Cylicostephanus goldi]